jgi:outer membrane receptor for ferrienterochelin and colicins
MIHNLMKHAILSIFTLLICITAIAQEIEVRGTVTDAVTKETLIGVNVFAEGFKVRGTTTDFDGKYALKVLKGDILVFRYIGYEDQTFVASENTIIDVQLTESNVNLNPVVISASRRKEKLLDAPSSITLIDGTTLQKRVTVNMIDQIKNVAGVHVARTGIQGGPPSIRGFGGYYTGNLMTLVDNRVTNLPSLRINAYSMIPTTDEDIDKVEVLRGPASALYGPNTGEGVVHMITKSPIDDPETRVSIGVGVRSFIDDTIKIVDKKTPRFDDKAIKDRMIFMAGFRHADTIALENPNLRMGYKISTRYFYGNDWKADDLNDPAKVIHYIPTYDAVIPLKANGTPLTPEEIAAGFKGDMVENERDETINRASLDGRMDFRIRETVDLVFAGGFNTATGIDMSPIGAIQNVKWRTGYTQARATWQNLFVQFYMNSNNSGDTYFVPNGGQFIDKGKMYALQAQYWTPIRKRGKVTYGIDGIFTRPNTEYTLHGRFEDMDNINEFGTYFQGDYEVLPRLTMLVASRLDYHNVINKVFVSPRGAIIYKPGTGQNLRATYNRAFRTPGAGSYFIDVKQAEIPQNIEIRAVGTIDPFRYNFVSNPYYNGQVLPQFKSPYGATMDTYYHVGDKSINDQAWQGILGAIKQQFLAQFDLEGNQLLQGIVDIMISSLAPDTVGGIDHVVRDLNSTTQQFQANEEDWKKLKDIEKLKNVTINNFELGYKGIVAKILSLSADV